MSPAEEHGSGGIGVAAVVALARALELRDGGGPLGDAARSAVSR